MMESVLFNPNSGRSSPAPEDERRSERGTSPTASAVSVLSEWFVKPALRTARDGYRIINADVLVKNKPIQGEDLRTVVQNSNHRVFLQNVNAHFCYVTVPFDMTKIHCTNVDFSNAVLINAFKIKGAKTLRGDELKVYLEGSHDSSERRNTVETALFTVNGAIDFLKNAHLKNLKNSDLNTLKIRIVQSVSHALNKGNLGVPNSERNNFITEANLAVKDLNCEMIELLGGLKDLNELNTSPKIEG